MWHRESSKETGRSSYFQRQRLRKEPLHPMCVSHGRKVLLSSLSPVPHECSSIWARSGIQVNGFAARYMTWKSLSQHSGAELLRIQKKSVDGGGDGWPLSL